MNKHLTILHAYDIMVVETERRLNEHVEIMTYEE
jgi:hypothetical protein